MKYFMLSIGLCCYIALAMFNYSQSSGAIRRTSNPLFRTALYIQWVARFPVVHTFWSSSKEIECIRIMRPEAF